MKEDLNGGVVLTWQQLLDEGVDMLLAAGITEAELDAWYLLESAFQTDRVHFFMDRKRSVFGTRLEKGLPMYREYLRMRVDRIPLQQILGLQEFMGLTFHVNEHVLIPRQDTEKLVEEVLRTHKNKDISVLDMCTGSGCIAISLAVLGRYESVVAVDVSQDALKIAQKNGRSLFLIQEGTVKAEVKRVSDAPWQTVLTCCMAGEDDLKTRRLTFIESDMFSNLDPSETYDVIVSNPPYIPSAVIEELEPEVRDYEPRIALDGDEDGLYFYRILAEKCRAYLKNGGRIYFEIGYDQGDSVSELLLEHGYGDIRIVKDETGLDRVAEAVWFYK